MSKNGLSGTPTQAPSGPTPYDLHFRRHVIPRLIAGAHRLAPFVSRGDVTFEEAHDALCAVALKLGAAGVSDLDSLTGYLCGVLSKRTLALMEDHPAAEGTP